MLSPDDSRLVALRAQAQVAMVTGMCECGCATVYLDVDRSRSRPAVGLRSPATKATSCEESDSTKIFWLILFLRDGWLSSLEIAYIDAMPAEFPPSEDFRSPQVGSGN
jgi:hypothetical protein